MKPPNTEPESKERKMCEGGKFKLRKIIQESSTKAGRSRKLEAKDPRKRALRPYSFRKEKRSSNIIKIRKLFYLN
jgi:hypothetical protein